MTGRARMGDVRVAALLAASLTTSMFVAAIAGEASATETTREGPHTLVATVLSVPIYEDDIDASPEDPTA